MKKTIMKVLMFLLLFSISAYGNDDSDFVLQLISGNNYRIIDYKGKSKDVVIPAKIGNKNIIEIGAAKVNYKKDTVEGSFAEKGIENVIISDSIVKIGDFAFATNNIKTLVLSNSIISIGKQAFQNNLIEELILPDSLKTIGEYAFTYNKIRKIRFPQGIKKIAAGVFSQNDLAELELPNTLEEIGNSTFEFNRLKYIIIPNSVKKIMGGAFSANDIEYVTLPKNLMILEGNVFGAGLKGIISNSKSLFIGERNFFDGSYNKELKYVVIEENIGMHPENGSFAKAYTENRKKKGVYIKEAETWNYLSTEEILAPIFSIDEGLYYDSLMVFLNNVTPDSEIKYTTDGSTPDMNSQTYTKPFKIEKDTIVKAIVYKEEVRSQVVERKYKVKKLEPKNTKEMVLVKAGSNILKGETIIISRDFYIGKYEVTQKDFYDLMGYNPSEFVGYYGEMLNQNPVDNANYYEMIIYANKLSEKDGLKPYYNIDNIKKEYPNKIISANVSVNLNSNGYKLPTINEWKYALAGGHLSKKIDYEKDEAYEGIWWSDEEISNSFQRIDYNYNPYGAHPVGLKTPNELGIHDMIGNLYEVGTTINHMKLAFLSSSNENYYNSFGTSVTIEGNDLAYLYESGFRLVRNVD